MHSRKWARIYRFHPIVSEGRPIYYPAVAEDIFRAAKKITGGNIMITKKQFGLGLLAVVSSLLLAVSGCSDRKKEISIKFSDCPAAVQKTIGEHAGGVKFVEVDQETKKGGLVVYEAKGKKADGKEIKIKVTADGSLVEFKSEQSDG